MNKLLLLLTMIYLSNHCISQQEFSTEKINLIDNHSATWRTYFENDQVRIEYQSINCDPAMGYDFEQVNFKFVNKTSTKLDLDWHIHLYRDDVCRTCNYPEEYSRTLRLAANESMEGNCDRETINELKLFSKFNDINYSVGVKLTAFHLNAFTITTVE
ncbi:MAG: hypothetical protein RI883_914 [Bacteroidota bacterium]